MAYMERLGLWGAGLAQNTFHQFKTAVEKGGISGMELVAMTMKAQGMLSCKSLSFAGVEFDINRVPLSPEHAKLYDKAALFWQDLWTKLCTYIDRREGDPKWRVSEPQGRGRNSRWKALLLGLFWSTQQRFFKQLQVAAKVPTAVALTKVALREGKSVVISLWSTSEARMHEKMMSQRQAARSDSEDDPILEEDFVSAPYLMIEHFVRKHMPFQRADGSEVPWASHMIDQVLQRLSTLDLPPNPLDQIIDELGGPSKIAEMTGRSHRLERNEHGSFEYVRRRYCDDAQNAEMSRLEDAGERVNIQEQVAFQHGVKDVAIISEAASAGISLHADRRQGAASKPRLMLTLELPWAADKAKQQFGRVHRSNQAFPPAFQLLVTELAGEVRFVSALTRRLILLGAMTRGDRKSSEAIDSLSDFNLHNKYGAIALEALCECLKTGSFQGCSGRLSFLPREGEWSTWEAFAKCAAEKLTSFGFRLGFVERRQSGQSALQDPKAVSRFLNRLLLLTVEMQQLVFEAYFCLYLRALEADEIAGDQADSAEQLHLLHGRRVRSLSAELPQRWHEDPETQAESFYYKLTVDRGVDWAEALQILQRRQGRHEAEGFYLYSPPGSKHATEALLVVAASGLSAEPCLEAVRPHLGISRRWLGRSLSTNALDALEKCEGETALSYARSCWERQFQESAELCIHKQRGGPCRCGKSCRLGKRVIHEHVLTGDVLTIWHLIAPFLDVQRQTNDDDVHLVQRPV